MYEFQRRDPHVQSSLKNLSLDPPVTNAREDSSFRFRLVLQKQYRSRDVDGRQGWKEEVMIAGGRVIVN